MSRYKLVRERIKNGKDELSSIRKRHEDLIVQFVTEIRARGYAFKTEQVYEQWVCRYIAFCNGKPPQQAGAETVTKILNELVVSKNVSASTQNQALNALVFLYKQVVAMPLDQLDSFARSKRKNLVPVVLTRQEVRRLLGGWQQHLVSLLYGTGMRLMKGLTLRVKDIDFDYGRIHVCQAKGKKDRFVPLPKQSIEGLKAQIHAVSVLHQQDIESGHGEVLMPDALARNYPNAARELGWQFQLCDSLAGDRPRYSNCTGAAGALGCGYYGDLYPRVESPRRISVQSAGSVSPTSSRELPATSGMLLAIKRFECPSPVNWVEPDSMGQH